MPPVVSKDVESLLRDIDALEPAPMHRGKQLSDSVASACISDALVHLALDAPSHQRLVCVRAVQTSLVVQRGHCQPRSFIVGPRHSVPHLVGLHEVELRTLPRKLHPGISVPLSIAVLQCYGYVSPFTVVIHVPPCLQKLQKAEHDCLVLVRTSGDRTCPALDLWGNCELLRNGVRSEHSDNVCRTQIGTAQ